MDLFFFYGTLMDETVLRNVLGSIPFHVIGEGTVAARLYDAGGYPALILPGEQPIPGRLVEVSADGGTQLDSYEGVAEGLYTRRQVLVGTAARRRQAWTYVYRRAVAGLPEIPSWPPPFPPRT